MHRLFRAPLLIAAAVVGVALCAGLARGADPKADLLDTPPVIELLVSPAAEPVPALKYRLLPSLTEETHGNAALDYHRLAYDDPLAADEVQLRTWVDLPADRLPLDQLEIWMNGHLPLFNDLEIASRRDQCDWQIPLAQEGFNTRLDEFQRPLRWSGRALALRARLQIAERDLDGALRTTATQFKLARDINQGGLLITSLIGCAVASMTTETLEAFVQHRGAPNLYWALTDLPVPLIDMRRAVEVEAQAVDYEFPELAVFRSGPVSGDEAKRLSDEILKRWLRDCAGINGAFGGTLQKARARFDSSAAAHVAEAKAALAEAGWSNADVGAMAPEQIAWLASDYHWRVYRDDLFRWAPIPGPERAERLRQADLRLKQFLAPAGKTPFEFELAKLMPSMEALAAGDRRQRPIAILRVVEALRLYAAMHQGELPESLEKITAVPIPLDPLSGKAFLYHRQENRVASLETPALHPNNHFYGRHYVIRVRGK
jgi:hypothetical protein